MRAVAKNLRPLSVHLVMVAVFASLAATTWAMPDHVTVPATNPWT